MKGNKVSIIISVFNEEGVLRELLNQMTPILEDMRMLYEIVFVNDGSSDASGEILRYFADEFSYIKVVNFSRNFGHEAAMIAGLDCAAGDYLICMDADLQHPPKLIPQIVKTLEEGNDIISMIRTKNASVSIIKKITSYLYYKLLNSFTSIKFQENASDFFAMNSKVAAILKAEYREKGRFLRGLLQGLGFKQTTISFEAEPRFSGTSKYTLRKLAVLALQSLVSFSKRPLQFGLYFGGLLFGGSIISSIVLFIRWIMNINQGFAGILITVLCMLSGIQFIYLGVLGLYIGDIQEDVKNRPIYVVESTYNIEHV